MFWFRHDTNSEPGDTVTDANGQQYETVDRDTAKKYAASAHARGEDVIDDGVPDTIRVQGLNGPETYVNTTNVGMLVTDTDGTGAEYPTKRYRPGY